jgi:cytochrome c oxidase subunit 2
VYISLREQNNRLNGALSDLQTTRRRHTGKVARIIGAGLLAICLCASSAAQAGPRRIDVMAKRFAFDPGEITVRKGETVELVLASGDVPHGLRIRELNVDLRVAKGKQATVIITPDKVGTFVGHCSVFCGSGHGQMAFTIHVVA